MKNEKDKMFEQFFGNMSIEELEQLDTDFNNITNITGCIETEELEKRVNKTAPLYTYFKNHNLIKPLGSIVCGYKKDGNVESQDIAYANLIKYKIQLFSILNSKNKASLMNEEIENGHLEIMKAKDKTMIYGSKSNNTTSMIPPKNRKNTKIKGLFQTAKHVIDLNYKELTFNDINNAFEKISSTKLENGKYGEPALIIAPPKLMNDINSIFITEKIKNNEDLTAAPPTLKTQDGNKIPVISDSNITGDELLIIGKDSISLRCLDTLPVLVKYENDDSDENMFGDSYSLMDCWRFYVKNPSWVAVIKNIISRWEPGETVAMC